MGLVAKNPVFRGLRTAKAQTSLRISAFVIPFLESTISKLATKTSSIFKLVSVAEETGLSLAIMETPKTGFLTSRSICKNTIFVSNCFLSLTER